MRVQSLFSVALGASAIATAHGQELEIPWVKKVVASMLDKFEEAVEYEGPTGTALAALASITSAVDSLVTESSSVVPTTLATAVRSSAEASKSPEPKLESRQTTTTPYWLESIAHRGIASFNTNPSTYQVFRNVKTFGAKGDGVTDDTEAIQNAIASGGRCGPVDCSSDTTTPAIVYFPSGTYLISSSILDYYYTQIIGNPNNMPVLKATPGFTGFGLIDGIQYQPGGKLGFGGATNTFWRQVRNIVFDLRSIPASSEATGIHWPTAQATSLQNCIFRMADGPGTKHRGMFIEEGSGGFLNDLTFYGGLQGVVFGNQQFTVRNLTFYNAVTAIQQIWDWGWTYSGITIVNCTTGFDLSAGGSSAQSVGSVTLLDSTITNTKIGILTARAPTSNPPSAGSLIVDNLQLNNVVNGIQGPSGVIITGGTKKITGYRQGRSYTPTSKAAASGTFAPFPRPTSLVTSNGRFYARSKPQYNNLATSAFVSVRAQGAKGDGKTDDTAILTTILKNAAAAGKIVFFDHGNYLVTKTLYVPSNSRIVGEAYPVILGSGSFFTNINAPQPIVKVGAAGAVGRVEWSDMIVSTQGPLKGAILIQWNVESSVSNPSGMWDVHTRIGGFAGSKQLFADCPFITSTVTTPKADCISAWMSMHLSKTASGLYMENVWLWVADHDIEDKALRRVNIYAGRGIYSESTKGNFWLVGTSSEHHTMYQYQFANTQNVFMGQIQTETAYFQPNPKASSPFPIVTGWNDPPLKAACNAITGNCEDGWGLRIVNSNNIFVYGAGLYSFFNNYSTKCSDQGQGASCQTRIFSIEGSKNKNIGVYNLNTIGSQQMVTLDGVNFAGWSVNNNVFPQTINLFKNYNG